MYIILEVLQTAHKAGLTQVLLDKAMAISQSAPRLSPLVIIQLAAEEAKVDELCN
jgi:tagatose-1,6-bisphosphate aldolase non-catalytic subunit AgaZ/GatZ